MLLASAFGATWIEALAREVAKCLSFRDTVLLVSIQVLKFGNLVTFQLGWVVRVSCRSDFARYIAPVAHRIG